MDYSHNLQIMVFKKPTISPPKGEFLMKNIFLGNTKNLNDYLFFQIGSYLSKIIPPCYAVINSALILYCNVEFISAGMSFL